MIAKRAIEMAVNGKRYEGLVEPRLSLADFLRDQLGLTGTHLGCEQGICGSCTVLFNGETVRSCLLLAVQAQGGAILTVEGWRRKPTTASRFIPSSKDLSKRWDFNAAFARRVF